jgi:hypothetical protein
VGISLEARCWVDVPVYDPVDWSGFVENGTRHGGEVTMVTRGGEGFEMIEITKW